jgi:2-dehydrotetronate isomerase
LSPARFGETLAAHTPWRKAAQRQKEATLPKLAANISMLFVEHPFLDRVGAAAAAGFKAVEIQLPYQFPAEELRARLAAHRIEAVLINAPPGNTEQGERGFAALPGRESDFRASLERALGYARVIGVKRIHVLAGRVAPSPETEAAFIANIRHAADVAAKDGVTIQIEPLNAGDNPGYFLRTTDQAVALMDRIARDNVSLQFDFYHCQITEGSLAAHAERLFGRYGHVQIAGVPGRNEPDRGEINYPYLFDLLDRLGYAGWVGCEYRPAGATLDGLGWAARWGIGRAR